MRLPTQSVRYVNMLTKRGSGAPWSEPGLSCSASEPVLRTHDRRVRGQSFVCAIPAEPPEGFDHWVCDGLPVSIQTSNRGRELLLGACRRVALGVDTRADGMQVPDVVRLGSGRGPLRTG